MIATLLRHLGSDAPICLPVLIDGKYATIIPDTPLKTSALNSPKSILTLILAILFNLPDMANNNFNNGEIIDYDIYRGYINSGQLPYALNHAELFTETSLKSTKAKYLLEFTIRLLEGIENGTYKDLFKLLNPWGGWDELEKAPGYEEDDDEDDDEDDNSELEGLAEATIFNPYFEQELKGQLIKLRDFLDSEIKKNQSIPIKAFIKVLQPAQYKHLNRCEELVTKYEDLLIAAIGYAGYRQPLEDDMRTIVDKLKETTITIPKILDNELSKDGKANLHELFRNLALMNIDQNGLLTKGVSEDWERHLNKKCCVKERIIFLLATSFKPNELKELAEVIESLQAKENALEEPKEQAKPEEAEVTELAAAMKETNPEVRFFSLQYSTTSSALPTTPSGVESLPSLTPPLR